MTFFNKYYEGLRVISWKTQSRFESKSRYHNFYGTKHDKQPFLNNIIKSKLISNEPFMLARFGGVELRAALNIFHLKNRDNIFLDSISYLRNQKTVFWELTNKNKDMIKNNAGFFPNDYANISLFQEKLFEDAKLLDVLGISVGLEHQVPTIPQNIDFGYIRDLEPWWFKEPWTLALKGKKVLVIYPYSNLIKTQYLSNRHRIYKNEKLNLPEFELISYEPIQTIAGIKSNFETWFTALEFMVKDIEKIDFDVAIIGAGAYGFSLAAEIKKMGRQAIQLGGATQLLFGIRAKRWEDWEHYTSLRGDGWIDIVDKPKGFEKIEGGCYW